MVSSIGMRPRKVGFSVDSPLEGRGFEPPVPLAKRIGLSGGTEVPQRRKGQSRKRRLSCGDRGFESVSLQRGVSNEPRGCPGVQRRKNHKRTAEEDLCLELSSPFGWLTKINTARIVM